MTILQILAATFLLISLALGAWSFSLFIDRGQPGLNVAIVDLLPAREGTRGGEVPERERAVPAGASSYVFVLNVTDAGSYSNYAVEVATSGDAEDEVLWTGTGLQVREEGNFSFELPGGLLQAGTVRIRLFGLTGEGRELVAEYLLRVVES